MSVNRGKKGAALKIASFFKDLFIGILMLIAAMLAGFFRGIYAWFACTEGALRDWSESWPRAVKCSRAVFAILVLCLIISGGTRLYRFLDRVEVAQTSQEPIQNESVNESAELLGYTSQPEMPILPKDDGPLSGVLVIIDPGHGGKTSWGIDPGCPWMFQGKELYEAAYTFRLAKEAADMVLAEGGSVAFTAWSKTMGISTVPSVAMPLPKEALLPDGEVLVNDVAGLRQRTDAVNALYEGNKGNYRLIVFISLHIDKEAPSISGLHVCYDEHAGKAPRLAELIAQGIEDGKYCWKKDGKLMPALKADRLFVINGKNNVLRHRVLVECGNAIDPNNSYLARSESNRRRMLHKVVVESIIKLAAEIGVN